MAVPVVNLTLEKGADFSTSFKIKTDGAAVNLTGYTLSCKMKKHATASTSYSFVATALNPFSSGVVKISMAKANISQIPTGRYIWELLITYAGTTTKAIKGTVIVEGSAS
jgi:hypothetical protein